MSRDFQWRTEHEVRIVSLDGKDLAQVHPTSDTVAYVITSLYHSHTTARGESGEKAVEADLNSILDYIEANRNPQ